MAKINKIRSLIREEVRKVLNESGSGMFWITPDGEFIEIHRTHMMYVGDYPLKFFNKKKFSELKREMEKLPFEAQQISFLKDMAVENGAIRGRISDRNGKEVDIEGKRWAIEENTNKILDVVPVGNVVFRVDVRKKGGDVESYKMNQEDFVEKFS